MNEATIRNMSDEELVNWVENRKAGFIQQELARRLSEKPAEIDCYDVQEKSDMAYLKELFDDFSITYIEDDYSIVATGTNTDWPSTVVFSFGEDGDYGFKSLGCF